MECLHPSAHRPRAHHRSGYRLCPTVPLETSRTTTRGIWSNIHGQDEPGVWTIRVEVTGSLGRVFVDAPPVEVTRLRNYMAGGFVFIGVSLVVVLAGRAPVVEY